jgi:hypothetical protein
VGWRQAGRARRGLLEGLQQKAEEPEVVSNIVVATPGGQTECEGTYVISDTIKANGKPVWKREGAGVPRMIYFSNTGTWMIDNNDAMKANFDCAIGYIHAVKDKTGTKMPWELTSWERYDNEAKKWMVDELITVTALADDLADLTASEDSLAPAEEHTDAPSTSSRDESAATKDSDDDDESTSKDEDDDDTEGHGPCAGPGEDCRASKCCKNPSEACFEKNEFYAACRSSCTVGMVEEDDEKEFKTPWSCYTWGRPLPSGGPPPPEKPKPCKKPAKTPADAVEALRKADQCKGKVLQAKDDEPSLLCFAVTRSSGDEFSLIEAQVQQCAGVFACDHWMVFSGDKVCLNSGADEEVSAVLLPEFEAKQGVAGALTATWVNTEAFMAAWGKVIEEGSYKDHDWVIKIDPDAVFIPSQLRKHLQDEGIKAAIGDSAKGVGAYLRNCRTGDRDLRMFGSIEVMSSSALETYRSNKDRCKTEVDWSLMGEDMWLQKCLDLLGIQAVEDYDMLLADGYCPGSATACTPDKVAFHPFKLPSMWLDCYSKATGEASE